jgi:uncharacterized protein
MANLANVPGLGLMSARYASGELSLGGLNILAGLPSESVIAFSYTDNTNDQADDLIVEIADPSRSWMKTYAPKKGSECTGKIKVYNWINPGDSRSLDCGTLFIDEIGYAGPPNVVAIKATSIPTDGIKNEQVSESWNETSLREIAQEKADKHGMTLVWATKQAPPVEQYIEQNETPDLEFLRDKAKDMGLQVRMFNKQLIFYSEEEYEAQPSVFTITYGASSILSYSFISRLNDVYAKAEVAYSNPDSGGVIKGDFHPLKPPEGAKATTRYTQRMEDEETEGGGDGGGLERAGTDPGYIGGDTISYDPHPLAGSKAQNLAKNKLRAKNKHEKEATIRMFGNPDYLSGLNAELVGFGLFDGKWFIEASTHEVGSNGYQTELKLHAALEGY